MQSSIIFGSMQAVSCLIFLFGVVNLINTTLSNQMSRKRESSILRSIGLTGKQLCRMNIVEGMCYAFFAVLDISLSSLHWSDTLQRSARCRVNSNHFTATDKHFTAIPLFRHFRQVIIKCLS